jgi:hypothetical protein
VAVSGSSVSSFLSCFHQVEHYVGGFWLAAAGDNILKKNFTVYDEEACRWVCQVCLEKNLEWRYEGGTVQSPSGFVSFQPAVALDVEAFSSIHSFPHSSNDSYNRWLGFLFGLGLD